MPQLDKLIILPQIFWLIILFSLFYFLTTFYFLPTLLKFIKSRKYFLNNNNTLSEALSIKSSEKRKIITVSLLQDFSKIRSLIFNKITSSSFSFRDDVFKPKYKKFTSTMLIVMLDSINYCNISLLKSLKFFPLLLNKKK